VINRQVPESPDRRGTVLAAALLAMLLVGLHYDVVFGGRSLIHTNYYNPIDFRPVPDNYGPRVVPHTEWANRNLWLFANIRDPAASWFQWEPSTKFLEQAIERREWPFWDPYIAGGTPAMANLVQAFFFPPYVLLVLLGANAALKNAYFLLLLWAASHFTYLFLRRHNLSALTALCGGALVMMSGAMHQNIGAFAGQTIAGLPIMLFATRAFLDRPTPSRSAGLSLLYATVSLASFPPLLIGMFSVTALYAVTAIALGDFSTDQITRRRVISLWLAASCLAVGLVGAYYVPASALARATPHVAVIYRGAGLEAMSLRNIYQLLSPTIMGGVQVYLKGPFTSGGWGAHLPYVGIVPIALALLASADSSRQRTLLVSSIASGSLLGLKIFGVPPVQWIGHLPFFDQIHFSHYLGVPFGLPLIFVAAVGFDQLITGKVSPLRTSLAAATALSAVASVWWIGARNYDLRAEDASDWIRDWRVLAMVGMLMSIVLVIAALRKGSLQLQAGCGLAVIALAIGEGAYNQRFPRPAAWDIFERPAPYVRVLRKEALMQRVFVFGRPSANLNEAFRIAGIDSLMAFNPPRMFELYHRYSGAPREVFLREATKLPPELVLDRANVSFVSTWTALDAVMADATARGYERRFDDGLATLFKRRTLPRFFFSSEYRVMPAPAVLEAVATVPSREILLEQDPGVAQSRNETDDPAVEIEDYGLNSHTVIVNAARPGLIYAAENHFDGWSATVNGHPTALLPANYAFRAVAVQAGRSRIEFRYRPPGLTAGLIISIVSAGLLIAMARKGR